MPFYNSKRELSDREISDLSMGTKEGVISYFKNAISGNYTILFSNKITEEHKQMLETAGLEKEIIPPFQSDEERENARKIIFQVNSN